MQRNEQARVEPSYGRGVAESSLAPNLRSSTSHPKNDFEGLRSHKPNKHPCPFPKTNYTRKIIRLSVTSSPEVEVYLFVFSQNVQAPLINATIGFVFRTSTLQLLDKPWSQVSSLRPPPRFFPSTFIAQKTQQSQCSSTFHQVLITLAITLSASQFVHKKKSLRIYTSMHSGGARTHQNYVYRARR